MLIFNSISRSCLSPLRSNLAISSSALTRTQQGCFKYASTTSDKSSNEPNSSSGDQPKVSGWLDKMFSSSPNRMHTGNEPHSRLLSATEYIYELHYHDAKPEYSQEYISSYEKYCKEVATKTGNKAELVGSFRVEVGDQDQFIHIWRYHDGYKETTRMLKLIRSDESIITLTKDHLKSLRKRENQFMMAFSFWGHPQPQNNDSFYEMRSYMLKPGTMIEWANGWSRGIRHRDNAVAGFFSQIGELYSVHHIWRYEDLQVRKDVRENAWQKPGWDECVAITVPNIVSLRSRWMSPNSFSPIR